MKGPGKAMRLFLMVATFMVGSAWAQHEEHQSASAAPQTSPQADPKAATASPAIACCATMSSTPAEHSMTTGMMPAGMSCPLHKVAEITGQLLTSFAAIENEKAPAALKEKLAAHETLLKQLQAASQQTCPMMDAMMGSGMGTMHDRMMSGPKSDGPTTGMEQEKK